jgi:hypothetical protein
MDALHRVSAFLEARADLPRREIVLGGVRQDVIEEVSGRVLFEGDLRQLVEIVRRARNPAPF